MDRLNQLDYCVYGLWKKGQQDIVCLGKGIGQGKVNIHQNIAGKIITLFPVSFLISSVNIFYKTS